MKRFLVFCCFFLVFQSVKATSPGIPSFRFFIAHRLLTDTNLAVIIGKPEILTAENLLFKCRLDSIQKDIPLDYNKFVQSYIDLYLRNRNEMAEVVGLMKYYFPIYEKVFHSAGIPDEIKYLSIVESKLNPFAVSKVGATGPWQFMFKTAKLYGLNINKYVDERCDPTQASYAAAAYLKESYEEFGDWLLAIASYNCGTKNVERAIEKAGGANDFWSIRPYLPRETRGYVPAFIAINYVMNYYNLHDIIPKDFTILLKTDSVLVSKRVSLKAIARALNVNPGYLAILNPQYKRQIINGTADNPRKIIVPQIDAGKASALNTALTADNSLGKKIRNIFASKSQKQASKHHNYIIYKVKKGDTLRGIAAKFNGVSVEKIRSINGLKKSVIRPGMTIKI